tara:strand:+ start:46 stop:150 length:105 start_codon:yes stop_codon:yes gene_type:complete
VVDEAFVHCARDLIDPLFERGPGDGIGVDREVLS